MQCTETEKAAVMAVFVAGPVGGSENSNRRVNVLADALCCAGYVVLCQADYWSPFAALTEAERASACLRQSIAALADQATALAVTAGWSTDATARALLIVATRFGLPCYRLYSSDADGVTLAAFAPSVVMSIADDGDAWDRDMPQGDGPRSVPSSVTVTPRHIAVNDPLTETARPDYDAVLTDLLTDMRRVLDDTVAALAVRREAS